MSRLADLAARLDEPLLITNLTNLFYLTGFDTSNGAVLVRPGGEATLYTDFRYIEAARAVDGVEAVMTKRALMADVGERLEGTVQFEADVLPYLEWQRLRSGGAKLVATSGIVDELRAVKDEQELKAIRRAARAADRAFEALTAEPFIGHSEREIAWRLRELLHAHGVDEVSFDTAVGYGPHGAHPHWSPTDTIISPGTLLVVDWGARLDGYCSDCTRTVSTGRLPDKLREIYDLCLEAQKRACAEIKAGMPGVEADAIARDVIEAGGYGHAFGHGLGHGVGLLIHEAPRLSTESTDTLAVGHVVTIEPGIYLEGVAGVRIEDLAIMGEDGVELLTAFPKELIEVR